MFKRAFIPSLILALGAGFFVWTMQSPFWQSLRQISGIMRLVHAEYVDADAVSYEMLAESAIRGMVESLDPYSRYMGAGDFEQFEELARQRYVGIGVEIERVGGRVTVVTAFPGGAASEVGIRPGDQILFVDGKPMHEAAVADVSGALRGPEGGATRVGLFRPSTGEVFEHLLFRRRVHLASVTDMDLGEDGIGYLRIRQFGERTLREFRDALDDLEARGLEGLVIDLRNNPGGLLSASKDVAGEFLGRDELIVYIEGRSGGHRQEFRSQTPARPVDYPLVVLINARSASGAEIVAGALQETGRAFVIGEKSYGKGSVQSVYAFRNGGGMRQTTALYYLPSGRSINTAGVAPDQEVALTDEEERRVLLQTRHRRYLSAEEFRRAFEHLPEAVDLQLEAARSHLHELLRSRSPQRV